MAVSDRLGIQSFCFRGTKKHEDTIARLKECGLSTIEICAAHVDFKNEAIFEDVIRLYKNSGVKIVSIGVQSLSNDEATERKYFKFAQLAGAKYMACTFALNSIPACFRTAEKLAEEFDIRLAIHNHGARHWLGTAEMLRHVFAQTNDRIGLCLDSGWAIDSREDPVKMAEQFANRLYGVHIKDFVYERNRKQVDVIAGTGLLDLKAFLKTLDKVGFNGYIVLEYEGDVNNPVPALKQCVEAVRKAEA